MTSAPLLTLTNIKAAFGSQLLFENINLTIHSQDKIALVGANGTGKPTLMKIMAQWIEPDHGDIARTKGVAVGYLPQNPMLNANQTIGDYIFDRASDDLNFNQSIALSYMEELSLQPDKPCKALSGGEIRKASLVKILAENPDLLLLDEPTNHLDIDSIQWLEEKMRAYKGALVCISHDRTFLGNITNSCLWLMLGSIRRYGKGFATFDDWSESIINDEMTAAHKQKQLIKRELQWLNDGGVTARRKRNQGRLERLNNLRAERAAALLPKGSIQLQSGTAELSGKIVLRVEHIAKKFGDTPVINDFSTIIKRNDRIGIVGRNGTGKTTLINIITEKLMPDSGQVKWGTKLDTLIIDQKRSELDPNATVRTVLVDGDSDQIIVHGQPKNVVAYSKDFLFDGAQIDSPIRSLSGGEQNRLLLAKHFAKDCNLLILDEPTNDLDMETLEVLENVISDFQGTVLIVSHDRKFLDNCVTSVIAFEGNGNVVEHAGGFTDYLERKAQDQQTDRKKDSKAKSTPAEKVKTSQQKLSFKHQHALKTLPIEIEKLQKSIGMIEDKLADANLYTKDPDRYQTLCKDLEEQQSQLSRFETEWLEIEIMREEIEQNA